MIVNERVNIIKNEEIAPSFYHLVVESSQIWKMCRPGQFAQVRISDTYDPLLRRPISFFNYHENTLEFVYKVVGYGTKLLTKKNRSHNLDIMGPLGTGFNLEGTGDGTILVVGGGMGIIPLFPLIKELKLSGRNFEVLVGARTATEILVREQLSEMGIPFHISTDDGSMGELGFITTIMEQRLQQASPVSYVFTVGPHAMIHAVVKIAQKRDIPLQVSLEERMACGIGACIGCVVMGADGSFKKVCKDGPVFKDSDIFWS